MRKVVCLVNMAALLVGFVVGSVLKVDLARVMNKKVKLQVLYLK